MTPNKPVSDTSKPPGANDLRAERDALAVALLQESALRQQAEAQLQQKTEALNKLQAEQQKSQWVADNSRRALLSVLEDEQASAQELRQWADAFDNCAHGIALVQPGENTIHVCNAAYAALLGRRRVELSGVEITSLYLTDDHALVHEKRAESDREGSSRFVAQLLGADGEPVLVQVDQVSVRNTRRKLLYRVVTVQDIRERQRAEQAQMESEERYRGLVEFSPDAIVVHSHGRLVFANPAAAKLVGAESAQSLLGRNMIDFVHPDSLPAVIARNKQVYEDRTAAPTMEQKYLRIDGSVIDVEVMSVPIVFNSEPASQVMAHDITERKRQTIERENTVERQRRQAAMITTIASSVEVANGDIEGLARIMTERGAVVMQVERVGVWLFENNETQLLSIDNYTASTGQHVSGAILYQHEFAGEFAELKSGRYMDAHDAMTDRRVAGYLKNYLEPNNITSMLDSLVRSSGRNLGTVCFEHVNQAHHWQEDEIAFACQLADQVALTMANRDQLSAESAVRETLSTLELVFNSSPDGQLITRVSDRKIISVNDGFTAMSGYTREDAIGATTLSIGMWVSNDDFSHFFAQVMTQGEELNRQFQFRHKNGGSIIAMVSAKVISLKGEPHIFSTARDVTALRQVEATQAFLADYEFNQTGEDFFFALAGYLAKALDVEHLAISRLIDTGRKAHTEALIDEGVLVDNIEYVLTSSPCDMLTARGSVSYAHSVAEIFPLDLLLTAWHAQSYVGVILKDAQGHPIGLISAIGTKPLSNPALAESLLQLVAGRAGSELARRMTDEILRESEARTRLIIATALDAIITMDQSGIISGWNPQAEKIFGWHSAEVIGKKLSDTIIPVSMRAMHNAGMARFQATGKSTIMNQLLELTALRHDGSEFPVELTIAAVPVRSGMQFSAFLRDITSRKQAADQLQQTLDDLSIRNRELQDFAFVASHDLQEPLRKIRSFSDRLLARHAENLDEQGRDYLARSDSAAERMQTLINDLLSYTRVGSRGKPFEPVDLAELIKIVLDDLETRIESSGGSVEVGQLPVLEADSTQMRQLFQNLLSNALKFRDPTRPPRVRIWAEPGSSERGHRAWEIFVEDNGIGFEAKYAEKIFAPFQRLHGRQEHEGTGIGLAIVRRIVERHHGRISAVGFPDEGSRFKLILPQRQLGIEPERRSGDGIENS